MLNSLKRTIILINKDDLDEAIYKTILSEKIEKPSEKYLNVFYILVCFFSQIYFFLKIFIVYYIMY
jgi:hypothetical protein